MEPRRPIGSTRFRVTLAVVASVSLAAALARVPQVISNGYHGATRAHPSSLHEADLAPLRLTAPTAVFVNAARAIPPDATFALIGGGNDVLAALRLWLAPRRLAPDYHQARWVIVYDAPAPADLRPRARVHLAPNVYVLEVAG